MKISTIWSVFKMDSVALLTKLYDEETFRGKNGERFKIKKSDLAKILRVAKIPDDKFMEIAFNCLNSGLVIVDLGEYIFIEKLRKWNRVRVVTKDLVNKYSS